MTFYYYSWPPGLQAAFLGTPFVIALAGVAMSTLIARSRDFELMIASLQNCLWVKQQVLFFGTTSLTSRCYLLSTICGAFHYPKFGIRIGMLDAEDLRHFPRGLKRKLMVASWLIIFGSVWLFGGVALIELFPPG